MENKVVCDYCGTIYDGSREKCPLCGSTTRAEAAPAAPRRRLTEEERKARRRTQQEEQRAQQDAQRARREEDRQARLEERRRVPQKQRSSKAPETQGGIPRGYLRAAVVFLTMAVLVVLFFIGDMIGWWPGLEDVLRATTPSETAAAQDDSSCTFLNLTPDHLGFSTPASAPAAARRSSSRALQRPNTPSPSAMTETAPAPQALPPLRPEWRSP